MEMLNWKNALKKVISILQYVLNFDILDRIVARNTVEKLLAEVLTNKSNSEIIEIVTV